MGKQVEQIIEVPKIQTVEKVVEVPQVQMVQEYQEVVQIQTVQKVVPKPYTTIQEQIIEVPRVEYQDVEGTTTTESVSIPAVKQATMGTTRQERVVGPDLEPVIYQQAPVQQTPSYVAPVQPTMMAAPTTSYVQPTTAYAAPTTIAAPVMTAPATVVGGSVSVPVTTTAPGGYIA